MIHRILNGVANKFDLLLYSTKTSCHVATMIILKLVKHLIINVHADINSSPGNNKAVSNMRFEHGGSRHIARIVDFISHKKVILVHIDGQ